MSFDANRIRGGGPGHAVALESVSTTGDCNSRYISKKHGTDAAFQQSQGRLEFEQGSISAVDFSVAYCCHSFSHPLPCLLAC